MKKKESNVGRPTIMTNDIVGKLEYAFSKGCSDVEACLYANIHKSTLYEYCQKHPEFTDRKEELKHTPLLKARLNIEQAIVDGDKDMSRWYAERKAKHEFSLKTEQDINANVEIKEIKITVADEEY